MKKGKKYSLDEINKFSDHYNGQTGMKLVAKNRRTKDTILETTIVAFFENGSYDNFLNHDGSVFNYHMKDDGGKVDPKGQEVNRVVVEKNGAHLFLQTEKEKDNKRYIYAGWVILKSYSYKNRYFQFNVDPEIFIQPMLFLNKMRSKKHSDYKISEEEEKYILISSSKKTNEVIFDYLADVPIDMEYEEGNVKEIIVKLRKRNAKLREHVLKARGNICQTCELNLDEKYKDLATPHVHHIKPLHEIKKSTLNSINDLIVLCPSCHSAIHKKGTIKPEELIDVINSGIIDLNY